MKHWINYVLLIGISLLLSACDDANKAPHQQSGALTNNVVSHPNKLMVSPNNDADLTNRDEAQSTLSDGESSPLVAHDEVMNTNQHTDLVVLDSSELILDGTSTLVVTFSVPIDSKQNFNNLVTLVDSDTGPLDGNWELSDNGLELHHPYLAPARKLTLRIDKMLAAANGEQLNKTYQTTITTRNREPMVGFSSNGSLLPSKSMTGLPVTTLNVNDIDVNFFRIKPDKIYNFLQDYGSLKQLSVWSAKEALSYSDLVYSARFNLAPKPNVQEKTVIDLSNIDALEAEGTYIAVLNQAGSYHYSNPITVFSISNIGLSVHSYKNGKLSIFTHRLDNGDALAGVKLTALCSDKSDKCQVVAANTNLQGYAELPLSPEVQYRILTASDGNQMSFIYLDRSALDLSEFNISGASSYQKQLFTFGPRDLYRPKETVYLNALLRDADGQMLPNQPIKAEIIDPAGQTVKSFTWQAADPYSGFYQTEFIIPTNAATGKWAFKLNLGDDIYRYDYFSVEEFLPERMAIFLQANSTKPIVSTQDAEFTIKSWYLYGAPASGNQLQVNPSIIKVRTIAQQPDFQIGVITENNLNQQLNTIDLALDNQGMAQINIDKQNWHDIKSPISVVLQTSVLDVGGRPITRSVSQSIWPASDMPAIRALFAESEYYDWSQGKYVNRPTVDLGEKADFDIAYIDVNGNKLSSEKLIARLIKERRDYYWSWSDSDGWQVKYDEKEFVLSTENIKVAKNGVARFSSQPDDYGSYRLEVIDPTTNLMSSIRFWCGYNWSDNTQRSGEVRPDQVKLSLDKPAYRTGDVAKVHVEAPVNGAGYISLETNDGTLWMQKINVTSGGIDVDIPISNWGRHDIYINAMIIRPSDLSQMQTTKRAVGLLYLPIDTAERQLQLTIDAPAKTSPEKTVKVKVHVASEQVENSKITLLLSAVDSGVLNITDFVTPDPYTAFLGHKGYHVDQFDVYDKLIEERGRNVGISFGGDSDTTLSQGGKKPLTNVNIIAQQLKTIELNSQGEGEIVLAIPDFNGELRLMAQAWDNNRFGRAESTITVAAPVIAELSLPRFLANGDQSLTALQLRNLTDIPQHLKIKLGADGLISLLNSQKLLEVDLNPQEQKVIQLSILAGEGFGQGKIAIRVDNIQIPDDPYYQLSRSWVVGVRPAYAATSRDVSVVLNSGQEWTLSSALFADLIDNTVQAQLMLSHNPPLNMAKYVKSLYAYPYGCLEQIISQLYPSLYINAEQLQKMGITGDTDDERHNNLQIGIDRLFGMQRNNGSFGLWSSDSAEEYWLTAYAVDFLLRAQERGYQVNVQGLNRAMNRLGQYLYDPSAFYSLNTNYSRDTQSYIEFATKTYAALILAKQNKITPPMRNELKRLYQQVKSNENAVLLSPLPIMQLSIASTLTGNNRSAADLLDIALATKRDSNYYWLGDYGSTIRDSAQVYNLMVEYQLAKSEQASYLLALANTLKNTRYLSTQELSALFLASWANLQKSPNSNLTVLLNDQEKINSKSDVYRLMDYDQLSTGVNIHNVYNASPVYVNLSLSGYSKKVPSPTASNNVLQISRRYFDMQGKPITATNLNVGDLVVVMLDVSADRAIYDALVVDMLPAGLELENPNLSNSSIDISTMPNLAELLKGESNHIKHQEYRDDRYVAAIDIDNWVDKNIYRTRLTYLARAITIGNYTVPAPYVESMYTPQWYAIGQTINSMSIVSSQQ